MTTTTTSLKLFAKKLFPEESFLGVFASDTLPNRTAEILKNKSLIINTDTHNLPGTHWVAILSRDNEAYFFDPFGFQPIPEIASWLNRHFKKWTFNKRQVQPTTSDYCGYFCLYFLYAATRVPHLKHSDFDTIFEYAFPKDMMYFAYERNVIDLLRFQNLQ